MTLKLYVLLRIHDYYIKNMGNRVSLPSIAILVTLGLFGLASNWTNGALWGINHLAFLGWEWMTAYIIASILIIAILFTKKWDNLFSNIVSKAHDFIFEKGIWPKVLVALIFTAFFYMFRSETHFLGDGYNLLSIFGQGEKYISKWVEFGSILILRNIQSLLGDYTPETMKIACQITSILSGTIVLLNIFYISKQITSKPQIRITAFISLLFSGVILLFFGYVEYYPLIWAVSVSFINASLYTLRTNKKIMIVLILFLLGLFIHMQILYYAPAVLFIFISKYSKRFNYIKINYKYLAILTVAIFLILLILVYMLKYNGAGSFFLPILIAPHEYYSYSLFSIKHCLDIVNLLFVMIPGILFLLTIVKWKKCEDFDNITIFLMVSSFGSILFLLFIDPIFGIGRDWDLMSLTLLSPLLLIIRLIVIEKFKRLNPHIISFILLTSLMTSSFVAANTKPPATVDRFESLLRYYEFKDETGWAVYAYYFLNNDQFDKALEVAGFMEKNEIRLDKTYHLLAMLNKKMGKYSEAEKYYILALKYKPYNPYFLNELGQVYLKTYQYEKALQIFIKANKIDPSLTFVLEGMGLAYIYLGLTDSTLVVAENLFKNDSNSPGGHLLYVTVAISQGEEVLAKSHFMEYLKYGQSRSDYVKMKEYYKFLL